jgi:hypothetical protein
VGRVYCKKCGKEMEGTLRDVYLHLVDKHWPAVLDYLKGTYDTSNATFVLAHRLIAEFTAAAPPLEDYIPA